MLCCGLLLGHESGCVEIAGLHELELVSVDARFRVRGARQPLDDRVVIVGIDDLTRRERVEVFQTRRGMARLVDAVAGYRPRAIGMDLLFDSPEVVLPREIVAQAVDARDALARQERAAPGSPEALVSRARVALDAVIEETRGDEILAQAIARAERVHLGVLFHVARDEQDLDGASTREPKGAALARYGEWVATPGPRARRPPRVRYISAPLGTIAAGAQSAGAVNVVPDVDGAVRRVYGVFDFAGRYYLPLGLSMALEEIATAGLGDNAGPGDASYVAGQDGIRFGSQRLVTTGRGELLLSFLGPGRTFDHVSAIDVLERRAPPDALADKLVVVGFTDAARDHVTIPFDPRFPGVEVHATLIHNALHGEFLQRASWLFTLLAIALLGLTITVLQTRPIHRRRWWVAAAAAVIVTLGYAALAQILFTGYGMIIDVAAPVASGGLVAICTLVAALATEGREKAQIRAAFSHYVSESLIEKLLSDPGQAALGGRRRTLTVLFSDIRGFASISENLSPEILSGFLSEYLTPMTEIIMDGGGMLDKYIGDAVMAVYGAPVEMDDHAVRACESALAMQRALEPLNRTWQERGLPEIVIGVGINSGPMSVGNMGSAARFDYTVLGDAVNLGARLESLTKVYRVDVLVGEDTVEQAGDRFVFRELDRVRVKGRAGAVRVYELRREQKPSGRNGDQPYAASALKRYAEALAAYRARDWDGAESGYREFLADHPDDGPAQVMLERIATLRADPPGEDWDGVFEQVSK